MLIGAMVLNPKKLGQNCCTRSNLNGSEFWVWDLGGSNSKKIRAWMLLSNKSLMNYLDSYLSYAYCLFWWPILCSYPMALGNHGLLDLPCFTCTVMQGESTSMIVDNINQNGPKGIWMAGVCDQKRTLEVIYEPWWETNCDFTVAKKVGCVDHDMKDTLTRQPTQMYLNDIRRYFPTHLQTAPSKFHASKI